MTTFGRPDRPGTLRGMDSQATISTQDWIKDAWGASKPSVVSTASNIPCRLDVMSPGSAVRMGFSVNETVYRFRCPVRNELDGSDIRILANQIVTVGGVIYTVAGSGKPEGRSGIQTAILKRQAKGGT